MSYYQNQQIISDYHNQQINTFVLCRSLSVNRFGNSIDVHRTSSSASSAASCASSTYKDVNAGTGLKCFCWQGFAITNCIACSSMIVALSWATSASEKLTRLTPGAEVSISTSLRRSGPGVKSGLTSRFDRFLFKYHSPTHHLL